MTEEASGDSNVFIMNETLVDKLKLLNYEQLFTRVK